MASGHIAPYDEPWFVHTAEAFHQTNVDIVEFIDILFGDDAAFLGHDAQRLHDLGDIHPFGAAAGAGIAPRAQPDRFAVQRFIDEP